MEQKKVSSTAPASGSNVGGKGEKLPPTLCGFSEKGKARTSRLGRPKDATTARVRWIWHTSILEAEAERGTEAGSDCPEAAAEEYEEGSRNKLSGYCTNIL